MNLKGFLIAVYSFISLLLVIVFMFLFKNKIYSIRKLWSTSMVKLIGVDIKEIGKIDNSADIILLNHNSMFDIVLLDYLYPKDIAWVANSKLAKVPVFGLIFKLPNLILIDPIKRSSIRTLITRVQEELLHNRPIGIFPEGTRGDNDEIIKFQKGIKTIVERLNLKVQPIVLVDTRERLDTKTLKSSSGEIKLIYLDTIQASNEDWYEELEKNFKKIYKQNKSD